MDSGWESYSNLEASRFSYHDKCSIYNAERIRAKFEQIFSKYMHNHLFGCASLEGEIHLHSIRGVSESFYVILVHKNHEFMCKALNKQGGAIYMKLKSSLEQIEK